MDESIGRALERGSLIDITTIGRRSGEPKRVELVFHNFDGHVYISGMPGPRDWYANLKANPNFTFHLKRGVSADLPARARAITDAGERRAIMEKIARVWDRGVKSEFEDRLQERTLSECPRHFLSHLRETSIRRLGIACQGILAQSNLSVRARDKVPDAILCRRQAQRQCHKTDIV